jgi:hypothetical protein
VKVIKHFKGGEGGASYKSLGTSALYAYMIWRMDNRPIGVRSSETFR